jgi:hypothetical protein
MVGGIGGAAVALGLLALAAAVVATCPVPGGPRRDGRDVGGLIEAGRTLDAMEQRTAVEYCAAF